MLIKYENMMGGHGNGVDNEFHGMDSVQKTKFLKLRGCPECKGSVLVFVDLYDETGQAIVVCPDHGVFFYPGGAHRAYTSPECSEIVRSSLRMVEVSSGESGK